MVAERCAILAGKNRQQRLVIYGNVKDLYRMRNSITHGDTFPMAAKGTKIMRSDLTHVFDKRAYVPVAASSGMSAACFAVIRGALMSPAFLNVVQQKGSNDHIRRLIGEYFWDCLLW